ncbi:MAG: geranylgeranylglyceryl/heptaprenylglyceryl phosphate synthase [bacterium]
MKRVYNQIIESKKSHKKLLALLIDPDKTGQEDIKNLQQLLTDSLITHIFVGGSTVASGETERLITELKRQTQLPIIIFPGDTNQITNEADALLFLSLISGRNAEYLIGKQVSASSILRDTTLEVIPTGYILVDGGNISAVQRVTETEPISSSEVDLITDTAYAGQLLGHKLIYLEAGSGAKNRISSSVIQKVSKVLDIPLIVGGGIKDKHSILSAFKDGADMVVIGTAIEKDPNFLNNLKSELHENFS